MKREARKQGAAQESGDLGSRFRQMLLPLLAGIVATKKSMTEWVTEIGLASVVALMEADAEQLVGPKLWRRRPSDPPCGGLEIQRAGGVGHMTAAGRLRQGRR